MELPPHSEYAITELGKTLIPLIEQLEIWGDSFSSGDEENLENRINLSNIINISKKTIYFKNKLLLLLS